MFDSLLVAVFLALRAVSWVAPEDCPEEIEDRLVEVLERSRGDLKVTHLLRLGVLLRLFGGDLAAVVRTFRPRGEKAGVARRCEGSYFSSRPRLVLTRTGRGLTDEVELGAEQDAVHRGHDRGDFPEGAEIVKVDSGGDERCPAGQIEDEEEAVAFLRQVRGHVLDERRLEGREEEEAEEGTLK